MFKQLAPAASHFCHWYVSVGVGLPVHVPALAVSVSPTRLVPLITGTAVFTGADSADATDAVCVDVALAVPWLFVPVSTTRIVEP